MEAKCPGCMLEQKAVQGTDDIIVNFRRPSTNQGILVEYVQTTAPITGRGEDPFVKTMGAEKESFANCGIPCGCTISASSCRPWKRLVIS